MLALIRAEALRALRLQKVQFSDQVYYQQQIDNLTQAEWDKGVALLSHPLLVAAQKRVVHLEAPLTDPTFDFTYYEDGNKKHEQVMHLLSCMQEAIWNAHGVLYVEFLKECSNPAPPYYAAETLQQITDDFYIPNMLETQLQNTPGYGDISSPN
ncbi:hypothetical protein C8R46DRAFT_1232828 [Mycena filopes]|nr:hypothetical protein C8R46DRAFT_1232828 [Mycena filopes]